MYYFADVEGPVHDLEIFRRTLNDVYPLLEDRSKPTKILTDKGYIGFNDSPLVQLVAPHKKPPYGFLSDAQVRSNQRLSSARIVVENYFGRLATRFHIVVRRGDSRMHFIPLYSGSAARWPTTTSCLAGELSNRQRETSTERCCHESAPKGGTSC
jgi:hypothetical protein